MAHPWCPPHDAKSNSELQDPSGSHSATNRTSTSKHSQLELHIQRNGIYSCGKTYLENEGFIERYSPDRIKKKANLIFMDKMVAHTEVLVDPDDDQDSSDA